MYHYICGFSQEGLGIRRGDRDLILGLEAGWDKYELKTCHRFVPEGDI